MGKLFELSQDLLEFVFRGLGFPFLFGFDFQLGHAFASAANPSLEFALLQQAVFVRIQNPVDPSLSGLEQLLGAASGRMARNRGLLAASAMLRFNASRVQEQCSDILPDGGVELFESNRFVPADSFAIAAAEHRAGAEVILIVVGAS
ncbi:hypothetical protein BH11PLA2_BH11PLA2_44580 [soil metagenome]